MAPTTERSSNICTSLTRVMQVSPPASSYSLANGVHRLLYRGASPDAGDTKALWEMLQVQLDIADAYGWTHRSVLVDSRIWGGGDK